MMKAVTFGHVSNYSSSKDQDLVTFCDFFKWQFRIEEIEIVCVNLPSGWIGSFYIGTYWLPIFARDTWIFRISYCQKHLLLKIKYYNIKRYWLGNIIWN